MTEWWRDQLGEDADQQHELLVNTLGNLTLTAYNSELSNTAFPQKRHMLVNSHLELNKYFSDIQTWDSEAIKQRAKRLANTAFRFGRTLVQLS